MTVPAPQQRTASSRPTAQAWHSPKETAAKYGDEQVHIWRRSYDIPPPPLDADDERHPAHDPRYAGIANLPGSESLKLTLERVLPCWNDSIAPDLKAGKDVLIAAHGNSLRDRLSPDLMR